MLIATTVLADYSGRIIQYCLDNGQTDISIYSSFKLQDDGYGAHIVEWNVPIPEPTEEMLPSEEDSVNAYNVLAQLQKPLALKEAENKFMGLCYQLTSGAMVKLTFDQINEIIEPLLVSDPNTAMVLSIKLLAIDAEAKREGGLKWWDDCEYHPEIVE